jgi:TRAP-type C4-dicarboxylate transport system permease small subunit
MAHDPLPDLEPAPEPKPRVPLAVEDVFAAICMGALALITFANAVLRYATNESIAWTEEISIALMVIMSLAAAGAAVARERHIRIDYFIEGGSPQRRRVLSLISATAVLVFFIALAILGSRMVWDEFRFGETSPGIGLPKWWYSIWLPLLSVAMALRAGGVLQRKWREGRALSTRPHPAPLDTRAP